MIRVDRDGAVAVLTVDRQDALNALDVATLAELRDRLRDAAADDVLVVVGGTIPREDTDELKQLGVAEVFGPGAATTEIVDFLKGKVPVS